MHKPFKLLRVIRCQYLNLRPIIEKQEFTGYVQFFNSEANELIKLKILEGKPLMVSKFGTVELSTLRNFISINRKTKFKNIINYIKGKDFAWWWETIEYLSNNAGVFPQTEQMAENFSKLMIEDINEIDILGSYIKEEKDFEINLNSVVKINLDG